MYGLLPEWEGSLDLEWAMPVMLPGDDVWVVEPTERIAEEVDAVRYYALTERQRPDSFDEVMGVIDHGEHTMQLRLKTAVIWAALTRPGAWYWGITDEDWDTAYQIMAVSASCRAAALEAAKRVEVAAATERLETEAAAADALVEQGTVRVINRIIALGRPVSRTEAGAALGRLRTMYRTKTGEKLIETVLETGVTEGKLYDIGGCYAHKEGT